MSEKWDRDATDSKHKQNSNLKDRVVIVTGAGRGIGREYARMFAAHEAAVAVIDIDLEGAVETVEIINEESPNSDVIYISVDVTDAQSVQMMSEKVKTRFGSIGILINNAGIWGDLEKTRLMEITPKYWDLVMAVNLKGALLCSQAVFESMRLKGWGRIINISSMGAYMSSGVYGVSKLALNQLTWALACELGTAGITVNAVAPGPIDNDATRRQVPATGMEKMINGTAVKRMGNASDIFGMIRYLASDDAEWVTGQTFMVNGGYSTRF